MADRPRLVNSENESGSEEAARFRRIPTFGALGDPQRLLASIVESSDDAILSKDLNGTITSWNRGAERMYGYSASEAIGRSVTLLIPPESENDVPKLLAQLRKGRRVRHYETVRMAKDGRRLTVSLTISPVHDSAGRVVGASAVARDISDRKSEEGRWRLLSELGRTLGVVLEADQLLKELARLMVPELADYCVTYLLDGDQIRRVGTAHADPHSEPLVQRLVELEPPTLLDEHGAGASMRTGEPVLVPEVSQRLVDEITGTEAYRRLIRELHPVSTMILPLQARGRTVGSVALVLTTRSNRSYSAVDLELARELADRAALALDNARLYEQLRSELTLREAAEGSLRGRYEQLRILYEISAAVSRAGKLEDIFERALDGLRDGLDVRRSAILLFDSDGVLRFSSWRGLSPAYRKAVEGHSPWGRDAKTPAPIVVPDVADYPDFDPALRAAIQNEGIAGLAFIPLLVGGGLLGKFMLYFDEPRELAADEVELARTIAGSVAFAIARMRGEEAVLDAKEAAERASEAKSQFLGIMSHELRTPLNAVLGYAELLLLETKGSVNPDQRHQLERIQFSARHQLELVDELLTYTRLEAGREEPRWLETDARRVINDVVELVRPEADSKGLELTVDLPEVPLSIITDPAKLRQVTLNLAGNATKYTERGEIVIRGRVEEERLLVEVCDTGPGIPQDRLEYIFQPFTRVDESHTRDSTGTGLGLAIARRLADLLGGDLTVRSSVGAGSEFKLSLPLQPEAGHGPPDGCVAG